MRSCAISSTAGLDSLRNRFIMACPPSLLL
jgi:hypothetical protein